ncbi:hypothetical protein [uncultured Helicobacter sp.]
MLEAPLSVSNLPKPPSLECAHLTRYEDNTLQNLPLDSINAGE